MSKDNSFKIKILFDDNCVLSGFKTGFGFSTLIYNYLTDHYILFDTGGNGHILEFNLNQFNHNFSSINKVIISHNHYDHSGGLNLIYEHNKNIEIYVPQSNESTFRQKYPNSKLYGVSNSTEIEKNVISSGEFKNHFTSEQFLMLKLNDNSLILLVGCSHPGLENFIIRAQQFGKIKGIIGGFHGFNKLSYLEGIEIIGACHCTQHLNSIKKAFNESFKRICVGMSLIF